MPDPGVPISHYLDNHPTWSVEITCKGCEKTRVVSMAAVCDRLAARGLDPRAVGIRALAGYVRGVCERCGGSAWETRPYRPVGG